MVHLLQLNFVVVWGFVLRLDFFVVLAILELCSADQAGLNRDSPVSASQMLRLQACATILSLQL